TRELEQSGTTHISVPEDFLIGRVIARNIVEADTGEIIAKANEEITEALLKKLRAAGAGIPAFFTKTGVGTVVADGKEIREFDGEKYVMERSLFADISLVKAWKADKAGNLVYRYTSRNFNPNVAMASHMTIVEVEEIVETGSLHPDEIHTPGIFVKRMVHNPTPAKYIEQRTTRSA
ncbi:MAG: 3-oxoacid CoA-transferase subunit A, partial [Burkholderiaceae bacterium]